MAHSYLAEALLYLDKISDSIENLNNNLKLESENDISFIPSIVTESDSSDSFNENFKSSYKL